jgi:hypothetical protein
VIMTSSKCLTLTCEKVRESFIHFVKTIQLVFTASRESPDSSVCAILCANVCVYGK